MRSDSKLEKCDYKASGSELASPQTVQSTGEVPMQLSVFLYADTFCRCLFQVSNAFFIFFGEQVRVT